jgi:carbon storage regulator
VLAEVAGLERQERFKEGAMLVLSRKLGEAIQIGPDIRITIAKIDSKSVRIGIEAPEHVSIKRQEIAFEMPRLRDEERLLEATMA